MNKHIIAFFLSLFLIQATTSQVVSEPFRLYPKQSFRVPLDTTLAPVVIGELRFRIADGKFYKCISLTGAKWAEFGSGGTGSPGGSPSHIQYNASGSFGGSSAFTFNGTDLVNTPRVTVNTSGSGSSAEFPFSVTNSTSGAIFQVGVAGGSELGAAFTAIRANGTNRLVFLDNKIQITQNWLVGGSAPIRISGGGGGSSVDFGFEVTGNTYNAGHFTATSGEQIMIKTGGNFASNEEWRPASGNAIYTMYKGEPIINTSGTYSGIIRGFHFEPNIIASTGATIRAFSSTAGNWNIGGSGKLFYNAPSTDNALVNVLVQDGSTGEVKIRDASTLGSGISLGAVGSSPNANGATLSAGVLNLQPADGSNPGVVSTGVQSFAGAKTFLNSPRIPSAFNPFSGTLRVVTGYESSPVLGFADKATMSSLIHETGSRTSNFTLNPSDEHVLLVDASSGAVTIDLVTAATPGMGNGRAFVIKKVDNSANNVIIDPFGSQTIDGATTFTLSSQWKYVKIVSNNTNWFVIGNN